MDEEAKILVRYNGKWVEQKFEPAETVKEAVDEGLRFIFKSANDPSVSEVMLDGGMIKHEPLTEPTTQKTFWDFWKLKLKTKRWKVPFSRLKHNIEPDDVD